MITPYLNLENSPRKNTHWLVENCDYLTRWRHTASTSCDVIMARAKRISIFMTKVIKLFSFLSSQCFLKGIENMYSVLLSSYRNTRESLGELEKAVWHFSRRGVFWKEKKTCTPCFYRLIETLMKVWEKSKKLCSISRSPKLSLVFL